MKKFRVSEIIFMLIGLFLTLSSILLLHYHVSLVQFFNLQRSPGDPFQASYYVATDAAQTITPTPTPAQIVTESPKLSLYLVAPLNQAVLTRPKKHGARPEKVLFKFEVYPKNALTTFELILKDKVIYTQAIPQTSSGLHELSVEIDKSGLYQWRVKAIDLTSELRNFTLHD